MIQICLITDLASERQNGCVDPASTGAVQLARRLADQGLGCTVILPVGSNGLRNDRCELPPTWTIQTGKGATVTLHFPSYVRLDSPGNSLFNARRLTLMSFTEAVRQTARSLDFIPDIFYGSFLGPGGIAAARMGRVFCRPAFVADGACHPYTIDNLGAGFLKREFQGLAGIIVHSSSERNTLSELGLAAPETIAVQPQAIDPEHFYPRGRNEARRRFGIPENRFVVAFAGPFTENGGIGLAMQAINHADGVYGIYAGSGPVSPAGPKTLFHGMVPPAELPWFYSAANVLLLPSRLESGRVVTEAMACGLPVISSRDAVHDDLLDADCSIRIDPGNPAEILSALNRLRDATLQQHLAACAWTRGRRQSPNGRARRIAAFIDMQSEKWLQTHAPSRGCPGMPAHQSR